MDIKTISWIKSSSVALFAAIMLSAGSSFIVASILVKYSDKVINERIFVASEDLHQNFNETYQNLQAYISRLQANSSFVEDVIEGDVLSITTTVNELKENSGLELMVVTDKDGVVLTRARYQGLRGDYFYETSPQGQVVGAGKELKMILSRNERLPLVLSAGMPLLSGSQTQIGSVVSAVPLDSEYANNFKEKFLHEDEHIIFYAEGHGVVGSSFDADISVDIHNSFLGLVQNFTPESVRLPNISIAGVTYASQQIAFAQLDDFRGLNGGAVVLVPIDVSLSLGIMWLLVTLLTTFVVGFAIFKFYFLSKSKTAFSVGIILIVSGIVSLYVFALFDRQHKEADIDLLEYIYPIYNSVLYLQPSSGIFSPEYEQRISVVVESAGEPINAIGLHMSYDPERVSVVDIIDSGAFCDTGFVIEKMIDNEKGEIRFSCGTLTPITDTVTVADLVVQPLVNEEYLSVDQGFELVFEPDTGVYAYDGLGTNVLRTRISGSYHIVVDSSKLILFSQSHPNSTRWYNTNYGRFSWRSDGSSQYWYSLLPEKVTTMPKNATSVGATKAEIAIPSDGVWYFHLWSEKNGPDKPVVYKIRSDKTNPQPPTVNVSDAVVAPGELIRIEFSSSDSQSGIEQPYYYVSYNGATFFPIQSPFYTSLPRVGQYTIVIRAFDNAGNHSDTSVNVTVKNGESTNFYGAAAVIQSLFHEQ